MGLDALDSREAALLVVDMQAAFVPGGSDVLPIEALGQACEADGIPVVFAVHEDLAPRAAAAFGSGGAEIVEALRPLAGGAHVVRKHGRGAFTGTRLETLLAGHGRRTLLVAGSDAAGAVEATIREAEARGLGVVAVSDGILGGTLPAGLCEAADSEAVLGWLADQRRPRTLGYGHMLLFVEDMARSVDFYVNQLGFTVRPAKPLADGRAFTAFRQGIAMVDGLAPGHRQVDHLAFEVNDVRGLADRLRQSGVPFFQDLHDGPYGLTVYIADPDGTKVELYETGLKMADLAKDAA